LFGYIRAVLRRSTIERFVNSKPDGRATQLLVRAMLMFSAALCAQPALAERLALAVGIDRYSHVGPLRNAGADAEAMAGALRKAGYAVTLKRDLDLKALKDELRSFRLRVKPGDEVVVYFAGHGVQFGGENYLLPVDVRVAANEDQVRDDAITLSAALRDLSTPRPALMLAIIDACRDNPFPELGRSTGSRGLARVDGTTGQMVMFSAGIGQKALDRLGAGDTSRNGVFTRVFVKEMERPGVPVDQVLKTVRVEVNRLARSVGQNQVPAIYDEVVDTYYFYPPTASALQQPPTRERTPPPGAAGSPAPGPLAVTGARTAVDKTPGATFKECNECPEMVVIPSGKLLMASVAAEQPTLVPGGEFAVGRYETTFDEWDACAADSACPAGVSDEGWGRGRRPAINVSWEDAATYVAWLSKKAGTRYRLLRDDEWQYMADGGARTRFPWGDTVEPGHANCSGCGGGEFERKRTAPVGNFRPNRFGVYDAVGNVWEWVDGCHAPEKKPPAAADASASCGSRITRGGSFRTLANEVSTKERRETSASPGRAQIGFRVARDLN
jgi:formylglycine-generating enzyme required for sulfatase activity